MGTLYLASASPRRVELLRRVGLKPRVIAARIVERRLRGETPSAMVLRLARSKAKEVAGRLAARGAKDGWVLAADTTVAVGSKVLEKPRDAGHAITMLRSLSGRVHTVTSGICLMHLQGKPHEATAFVEATRVFFRDLSDPEIKAYVDTGEPLD